MSQALLGIPCLLLLAWLTSSGRRQFPFRLVITALVVQVVLAWLFLKVPLLQQGLMLINSAVLALEAATAQGTEMVFGFLGGGPAPYEIAADQYSFILAFRALPIVIMFAAVSALLWHWRVIPMIIRGFAALLTRAMGISGALSVGSACSLFVGMVESPLLIRPYLEKMSNSELFMLMTCGMATVAGTVLGLYAGILAPVVPDALSHIVLASLLSVPAALAMGAILVPPTSIETVESLNLKSPYQSSLDAVVTGTGEGLKLLASIIGMLIVFVGLVHLVNLLLGLWPTASEPLTLVGLGGTLLAPFAWLLGVPWSEAETAGQLLASKVFINELVAYLELAALAPDALTPHSRTIMTYALCGFANFGSLGILLGGLTALCPARRADILALAPRSIWSGLLATSMTGAIVGLLV